MILESRDTFFPFSLAHALLGLLWFHGASFNRRKQEKEKNIQLFVQLSFYKKYTYLGSITSSQFVLTPHVPQKPPLNPLFQTIRTEFSSAEKKNNFQTKPGGDPPSCQVTRKYCTT